MLTVTSTELKNDIRDIFDHLITTNEPLLIKRPDGKHMVVIMLSEYELLKETIKSNVSTA